MMRLPRFRYWMPKTAAEAVRIKEQCGPEGAYVAGGTDLYPNMKRRQQTPKEVVGLSRVRGLAKMRFGENGVSVGASVALSVVESDPRIRRHYPALAHAITEISTPPLRNMGTLGGNLLLDTRCNYYDQTEFWRQSIGYCLKKDGGICLVAPGSPRCWAISSADTAPVLVSLNALARLVSVRGERLLPVRKLFRDDGMQPYTKEPDEILSEIILPPAD